MRRWVSQRRENRSHENPHFATLHTGYLFEIAFLPHIFIPGLIQK